MYKPVAAVGKRVGFKKKCTHTSVIGKAWVVLHFNGTQLFFKFLETIWSTLDFLWPNLFRFSGTHGICSIAQLQDLHMQTSYTLVVPWS